MRTNSLTVNVAWFVAFAAVMGLTGGLRQEGRLFGHDGDGCELGRPLGASPDRHSGQVHHRRSGKDGDRHAGPGRDAARVARDAVRVLFRGLRSVTTPSRAERR